MGRPRRDNTTSVCQLQGGIHRYLEAFPDGGLFKGTNFVFDRRVQMQATESSSETIGTCSECSAPWGSHHGGRVCCVCRKLVLVCNSCDAATEHGEYWCTDHAELRDVYFHFVDRFTVSQLEEQMRELKGLLRKEQ